jgi:hypothetical protein
MSPPARREHEPPRGHRSVEIGLEHEVLQLLGIGAGR